MAHSPKRMQLHARLSCKALFTVYNNMLQFVGDKKTPLRVAFLTHIVATIVNQCHRSPSGGHFSVVRTHKTLSSKWWWERMYSTTGEIVRGCPECAYATGVGRHQPPPLCPIPVKRPFQIVGVVVMDIPVTS